MSLRVLVDETKAKSYVVVAASCLDVALGSVRRVVGNLVLPRQRSLHMKQEGPRRRGVIADEVARLAAFGVQAMVIFPM